jgi:hypothetical protein
MEGRLTYRSTARPWAKNDAWLQGGDIIEITDEELAFLTR